MKTEYECFDLSLENGVLVITLNVPERGNPINGTFCTEMADMANQISVRPDVRAVLLKAEGKVFSYGGDVAQFMSILDDLPAKIKAWTTTLHSAITRLQRMDAPIVAQVHSVCAGGMAGFVAGADIVVASTDVKFVAAYPGIGFCCDAGTSVMMSRRLGLARARRYLLLNETIDGGEALSIGLVDKLVSSDELEASAMKIARKLANGPTLAYGEIRRLLLSAQEQPLESQLELEAQGLSRMAGTKDAHEGLSAFSEKRKPVFKGH